MKKFLIAAAIIGSLMTPSHSKDIEQFGDWFVSHQTDPFGEKDQMGAFHVDGNWMFMFRCIGHTFQMVFTPMRDADAFTKGDSFEVKFRAGNDQILSTVAVAVEKTFLQVIVTDDMLLSIPQHDTLAFRFEDKLMGSSFLRTVDISTAGAAKSFNKVVKFCARK